MATSLRKQTSQDTARTSSRSNDGGGERASRKKEQKPMASMSETMKFIFECGPKVKFIFSVGVITGVLNGMVQPALAYLFSRSFSDLSAIAAGLDPIRELAFTFMIVGVYALFVATLQSWCFEIVAYHASRRFRLEWFKALLRQDCPYFDFHDVGGIAAQVGPHSNKFRRGLGRKFGEGIQFLTTAVGGLVFAFWSSWKVALVILSMLPFVSVSAYMTMAFNQQKGARAAASYRRAGGVAYIAVSAIKTVLSLNAVEEMIRQYAEATQDAFKSAKSFLLKQGFAAGSMLGSFMCLYGILTLYGTFLIYSEVQETGCDPSGGVEGNSTCSNSAPEVFGAMLGVAFAGQGASQFGNFSEAFAAARAAAYEALKAINRKAGQPEEVFYKSSEDDDMTTTVHSSKSKVESDIEEGDKEIKAILPAYEIDSSSTDGLKPENIKGAICFNNVFFSYPTRPDDPILDGLSLDILPGQVVALVGPSGSGKSSCVSMVERFYDPVSGFVTLDGINLKDLNVTYLRSLIGYVSQEPTLFATSIRANIKYGKPDATQEEIEAAARMANAHDFIMSFPDGYDTQVGDTGSQLSGGQKQRLCLCRILLGNPKILLLDEATSALDAESELVVQDALDNILAKKKITTIIVAHRLSTIRNADVINVIAGGKVIETGTHDKLMAGKTYYRKLVEKQEESDTAGRSPAPSRNGSAVDLPALTEGNDIEIPQKLGKAIPHIEFKDVSFAYPTRQKKKIFSGFNLTIGHGETVALCGPSGGGKSTTVALINRFYDPTEGAVEYMGHNVNSLNVQWYRDQIGYVGQEPTLFNETIARNIAYGKPNASLAEIEQAATQANAHDFIMQFPEGYQTVVGERGTQLSGGQKQRVAIARALIRKPPVLILDEATSALDNESEAMVQAAIDQLMQSRDHTVIVIAHRLSTIRNADCIALIANGKVLEYGSHDELVDNSHGRYKRLFESSKRRSTLDSVGLRMKHDNDGEDDEDVHDEEIDWEDIIQKEEAGAFNAKRARNMAKPDSIFLLFGSIGAVMAGGVFPMWGVLFSQTINLLFRTVFPCSEDNISLSNFSTCDEYWDYVAFDMRQSSFELAGYWAIVVFGCLGGNMLTYWGFGMASERLNKRVRDSAFTALLRQEMAFFDKRSVGSLTSQLQDDTARIHTFSGEPVRSFIVAVSSVLTGVVISLIMMWPFALLAIACIPFMGLATSMEMKQVLGEDEGDLDAADGLNTAGGIIVETLLNIRTVSALALEEQRYEDYERALLNSEPSFNSNAFMSGLASGLSQFVQQWINALQFWWGGYLLFHYPDQFTFLNYLISNFAVLFALFGLGSAFQDVSDRKEVEKSAGRIFYLLDRESEIDPLSPEGIQVDRRN